MCPSALKAGLRMSDEVLDHAKIRSHSTAWRRQKYTKTVLAGSGCTVQGLGSSPAPRPFVPVLFPKPPSKCRRLLLLMMFIGTETSELRLKRAV